MDNLFDFFTKKKKEGHNLKVVSDPLPIQEERRIFPRWFTHDVLVRFNEDFGSNHQSTFIVKNLSRSGFAFIVGELDHPFITENHLEGTLKIQEHRVSFSGLITRVENGEVGIRFLDQSKEDQTFIEEHLKPYHLGESLKEVQPQGARDTLPNQMAQWFHGIEGTDLFIWRERNSQNLERLQFAFRGEFIEWQSQSEVMTGALVSPAKPSSPLFSEEEYILKYDEAPNPARLELAQKIVKSSKLPESLKKALLEGILSPKENQKEP